MKNREIIYRAVKISIDEWNPFDLLPEAPNDEFDSESRKISNTISENSNVDEIAEKIAMVFSLSFGEKFDKTSCIMPAKKIVDILENAVDN